MRFRLGLVALAFASGACSSALSRTCLQVGAVDRPLGSVAPPPYFALDAGPRLYLPGGNDTPAQVVGTTDSLAIYFGTGFWNVQFSVPRKLRDSLLVRVKSFHDVAGEFVFDVPMRRVACRDTSWTLAEPWVRPFKKRT